jgi:hypothetical protein
LNKELAKFTSETIQNLAEEVVAQILQLTFKDLLVERFMNSAFTDIEITDPALGRIAVCEVSTDSDPDESRLNSELARIGNWIPSNELVNSWLLVINPSFVYLRHPNKTINLIKKFELQSPSFRDYSERDESHVVSQSMRNLGVLFLKPIKTGNYGNGIYVFGETKSSTIANDSEIIDAWIDNTVNSDLFVRKQSRLEAYKNIERHLAIVIGSKTPLEIQNMQLVDGRFGIVTPRNRPRVQDQISDLWIVHSWHQGWWRWNRSLNVWQVFATDSHQFKKIATLKKLVFCP